MEFIPYHEVSDSNFDLVYLFKIKNDSDKAPRVYKQEITIDGLNDNLLLSYKCSCQGYFYKKTKCKHINLCLETLKKWGIMWRELSKEE